MVQTFNITIDSKHLMMTMSLKNSSFKMITLMKQNYEWKIFRSIKFNEFVSRVIEKIYLLTIITSMDLIYVYILV